LSLRTLQTAFVNTFVLRMSSQSLVR